MPLWNVIVWSNLDRDYQCVCVSADTKAEAMVKGPEELYICSEGDDRAYTAICAFQLSSPKS